MTDTQVPASLVIQELGAKIGKLEAELATTRIAYGICEGELSAAQERIRELEAHQPDAKYAPDDPAFENTVDDAATHRNVEDFQVGEQIRT